LKQSWKEAAERTFRKPNIEPPVFDLLAQYMYTGKIEMTMDILAPVVDAAMELQLTQLVSACENYSCQEVGMKSVFEMLALADRHGLKKLWTAATSFFCIYAEKLLDTDDWQGLDRDVLTKVLSLDSIIAKELSVWSTVVRYAHHQNGYDHIDCPLLRFPKWPGRLLVKVDLDETDRGDASSTSDDNNDSHDDRSDHEDENGHRKTNDTADPKDMIVSLSRKQFLDLQDVIEHMLPAVRFTSLPIVDFVRCIDGTGLVPASLSRQVYWRNLLPPDSRSDLAPPRFHYSSILPCCQWPQVQVWLMNALSLKPSFSNSNSRIELQRIYLASKDGFSTEHFHKHCDNQGPTLTVARTSTGYFFGGYNEASWFSDGQYHSGDTNFLFQYNPQTHLLLQATLRWHKQYASGSMLVTGPTFGVYDLRISGDGRDSVMSKSDNVPAYDINQFGPPMKFTVTDYEVFKIWLCP
ncbi:hypothetical protein DFQ27_005738, partial [Actinomortierella ambigua]